MNKIMMIGGVGSSGTTILSEIWRKHPDVFSLSDWRLFNSPDGILEYINCLKRGNPHVWDQSYRRLSSFLQGIERNSKTSKIIDRYLNADNKSPRRLTKRYFSVKANIEVPGYSEMLKTYLDSLVEFQWSGHYGGLRFGQKRCVSHVKTNVDDVEQLTTRFYEGIVAKALANTGKTHFLDKSTWNILELSDILRLVPNSGLVHISRDPRDIVASYTRQTWMPTSPVESAHILRILLDRWEEEKKLIDLDRYMEVDLYQLVAQKESVLRDMSEFWGIDFNDSLLDIDLSKANAGRWKKQFTSTENANVRKILGKYLDGYD